MTYADTTQEDGKRICYVVEIDLDYNTNTQAATDPDTGEKCYNTPATSEYWRDSWVVEPKTRTFTSNKCETMAGLMSYPCVESVSFKDDEVNIGDGLPASGKATIICKDFLDDDTTEDPYWSSRTSTPTEWWYWRRLMKRNPYVYNRSLRLRYGYWSSTYDATRFATREYLIREITGPDKNGMVKIEAISPIQQTRMTDAEAPLASKWTLDGDITDTATTAKIENYESGDPTSGKLRISDEIMTYTRTDGDLTFSERGSESSTAAAHSDGDSVQPCLDYDGTQYVDEVLYDLLVNYAGIDSSFIDQTEWQNQRETWLKLYLIDATVSDPMKVGNLVNELCEQCALTLWYNPETGLIELRPIRPPSTDTIKTLDDDNLLQPISDKIDLGQRVSRCDVLFGLRSPVLNDTEQTSYRVRLVPTSDGEGEYEHQTRKRKLIKSRWFRKTQKSQASRTATTIQRQRVDGKITYTLQLDAEDAADIILADTLDVTSRDFSDPDDGSDTTVRMQVIAKAPIKIGHSYKLVCEKSQFAGRYIYLNDTDFPANYSTATEAEQDPAWYLSDSDGKMPNGDEPYRLQ